MSDGLEHLIHNKRIREVLKNVKGMTPEQIKEEISYTYIPEIGLRIHREIDKRTIDILSVTFSGEITVIK